ncbi:CYP704B1 [Symbiodinium sp. CCMP2592]|nr:CYP704B1 [Symbiodinium sp. CCMP2592]
MPRSWAFYELTRNPDVQSRLHDEIMEKLPPGTAAFAYLEVKAACSSFLRHQARHEEPNRAQDAAGRLSGTCKITRDHTPGAGEMPYLNGVMYEALRLWPPVPFDPKMAFEDDVLPGGWKVPALAQVAYCPYNMGRDPKRYPEPEVAQLKHAFRPERWIPFTAPSQHEFPVFQAGMDMALFEAKTAAVELLRHCRFEMVPGQNITYGDKITLDIKSNGKEEFLVHVRDW